MLALATKGRASPALLDSYEIEGTPVIAEMLQLSTQLYDQFNKERTSGTASEALNRAGETVKATEDQQDKSSSWFRSRKLFQLDVNYRWSTVIFDERFKDEGARKVADVYGVVGRATQAGDRAPDAPALIDASGTKTRLFDIFSLAKHAALVFAILTSVRDALTLLATAEAFGGPGSERTAFARCSSCRKLP